MRLFQNWLFKPKNIFNLLGIAVIIGISFIACGSAGGNGGGSADRPDTPQLISGKTAMEYFKDEGLAIGINLGNTLDAVDNWTTPGNPVAKETAWGNVPANQAHFYGLRDAGFKIVRIPVTWTGHIGPAPGYKISEARLKRVADVVNMAEKAGLKAIINIHHDGNHDGAGQGLGGWLDINKVVAGNTEISNKFEKLWEQIAEYFMNYGDWLMFQGFNEIHDGTWKTTATSAEYVVINNWNQRFTNAVRSTGGNNTERYLLYYGYMTSHEIAEPASLFKLPTDTVAGKQIVGFHFYEPSDFAIFPVNHIWDSQTFKNRVDTVFGKFKTKFIDKGIPVIIGENGPARYVNYKGNTGYNAANVPAAKENRLLYVDYFYGAAKKYGLVSFYWENGPSFDDRYPERYDEGDFGLFSRTGPPNSTESKTVIERMIAAVNGAASNPQPVVFTLPANTHNPGSFQAQRDDLVPVLSGAKITTGDKFTFTYSYTSNVTIGKLDIVLVDVSSGWAEFSGWIAIGNNVQANTVVSGSQTITATATAANTTAAANKLVFDTGDTGTASSPTLTFTTFSIVKN